MYRNFRIVPIKFNAVELERVVDPIPRMALRHAKEVQLIVNNCTAILHATVRERYAVNATPTGACLDTRKDLCMVTTLINTFINI